MSNPNVVTRQLVAKTRVNLDWTRDDFPDDQLTSHQRLIRNVDWTKSFLGPMSQWPEQLRQMVIIVDADPLPACFIQFIGTKHPTLLGQDPRVGGFAELWDHFDNLILEGERTGITHIDANNLVYIHRHGYMEETYFSYKFIPLIGPEGHVVASYATVGEATATVIDGRREAFTVVVTQLLSRARDIPMLWQLFLQAFEQSNDDLPFVMVYVKAPGSHEPSASNVYDLAGTAHIPTDHSMVTNTISLAESGGLAPALRQAKTTMQPVKLCTEDGSLAADTFDDIFWRGAKTPIETVIVWPISSLSETIAFVVLGTNPHLRFDSRYLQWLQRIMDEILAYRVSMLQLEQEKLRRTRLAKEAESDKAQFLNRLAENKKFTEFAERTSVALCITNINGDVAYANTSWYNFSGISASVASIPWLSSVIDEDLEVFRSAWTKVTIQKESATFQYRSKTPFEGFSEQIGKMSAAYKTGYCAAYPEFDEYGVVVSVMGIIVDISGPKWIEQRHVETLEASEKRYRQFAQHAPVGLCRMTLSGLLIFANDSWTQLFGLNPEIGSELPFLEVVHPDDLELSKQFYADLCTSTEPIQHEIRLRRQWTSPRQPFLPPQPVCLLVSGHAEPGPDGQPQDLVWWCTDITQMKAASNAVASRMEEMTRQKMQQEAFIDMISHELRNPMSAIMSCSEEIVRSHDSPNTEDLVRNCRMTVKTAQTISFCVEYQKQIIEDVLVLSKLDADMLELEPVPVPVMKLIRHAMNIFDREFRHLKVEDSIQEESTLSRHGLEWALLDPQKFLQILMNLMTNAIDSVRESPTKSIQLNVSASTSKPAEEAIEWFASSQLAKGRSFPTSKRDRMQNARKYLMIQVTDNGKGITPGERANLMSHAPSAKTLVKYGEAGLGLFIARRIVGMMNGRIGTLHDRSRGNTFLFYIETQSSSRESSMEFEFHKKPVSALSLLPLLESDSAGPSSAGMARRRPPSDPSMSSTIQPVRLLLVEDNILNQKVASRQLKSHSYKVTVANHGLEALELLQRAFAEGTYFNIVLCDIEMPVMNGIDCVKEIRRLESASILPGHVPVLAVTANARPEQVNMALEAGVDGVVTKPYRINQLVAEIQKYTG